MTRISRFTTVAFVASALTTVTAIAQNRLVDVTGKWSFAVITENGTGTPAVVLKQDGEKLTGTYESARMGLRGIEGTVKKDSINFVLTGGEVALQFSGVVTDKDNMKGIVDLAGQGSATFTGARAK